MTSEIDFLNKLVGSVREAVIVKPAAGPVDDHVTFTSSKEATKVLRIGKLKKGLWYGSQQLFIRIAHSSECVEQKADTSIIDMLNYDCWLKIFKYLSPLDKLNCDEVCDTFHREAGNHG